MHGTDVFLCVPLRLCFYPPDVLGFVEVLVGAPGLEATRVAALCTFLGVDFSPVLANGSREDCSVASLVLQVRWARHKDHDDGRLTAGHFGCKFG